jgi:hypothetical protein
MRKKPVRGLLLIFLTLRFPTWAKEPGMKVGKDFETDQLNFTVRREVIP